MKHEIQWKILFLSIRFFFYYVYRVSYHLNCIWQFVKIFWIWYKSIFEKKKTSWFSFWLGIAICNQNVNVNSFFFETRLSFKKKTTRSIPTIFDIYQSKLIFHCHSFVCFLHIISRYNDIHKIIKILFYSNCWFILLKF